MRGDPKLDEALAPSFQPLRSHDYRPIDPNDPGYRFDVEQGMKALERSAVAHDYRPLLPQLQRDLIDQLQRELAHERSCKLALLATIEDLQTLVRTLTRERGL